LIDAELTDGSGYYEFCGLMPGTYTVEEVMEDNYRQISAPGPITLVCDDSIYNNFTNEPLGKIIILKYDGSTEPLQLLGGATFTIEPNPYGGPQLIIIDGGLNDPDGEANGTIILEDVPLGCYWINETVAPPGYDLSPPNYICITYAGEVNTSTHIDYPLGGCSLTPGYWKTHSTYGPASKPDPVWMDDDMDGDGTNEGPDEQFFDSSKTWLSIMNMKTNAKTKTYQQLAFHYVAAYLNGLNNGNEPAHISANMSEAERILDQYDINGGGADYFKIPKKSADEALAKQITSTLGFFNEGCIENWPHCDNATLTIYKINDRTGEPIPGWNFSIYNAHCDTIINRTTDAEGKIEMDIGAGYYEISEELTGNWTNLGANPLSITIAEDENKTVYIHNAQNDPPVANDDAYFMTKDATLTVGIPGVLNNDNDPDGDEITVLSATSPSHESSFSIWGDGHFTYHPETDYVGIDTFTYTISDGYGGTDTAVVTITIEEN
jgi:hypothetical protein